MTIFTDTSAIYSLLDRDDANHKQAKASLSEILDAGDSLLTTNYVLIESFALLQHRIGMEAARTLHEDILPIISIEWVHETVHRAGVSALLAASKRRLSLVDCVSFETMRALGIRSAFAFDPHFSEQGFTCIPGALSGRP